MLKGIAVGWALVLLCLSGYANHGNTPSPSESSPPTVEEPAASPGDTNVHLSADELMPDPFEPFNRVMFEVNYFIDGVFLSPAAHVYKRSTPNIFRRGVSNVLSNLWGPISILNHALQGKGHSACEAFARFFINTTIGILGIFDVAELLGAPESSADFSQTLTVWGIDPGPYLVLPIIGPTSGRDAFGRLVDNLLDPFNIYMYNHHYDHNIYIRTGLYVVSKRSQAIEAMDSLEKSSIDLYATIRSLYQQQRLNDMVGGEAEYYTPGPEAYADDKEPF